MRMRNRLCLLLLSLVTLCFSCCGGKNIEPKQEITGVDISIDGFIKKDNLFSNKVNNDIDFYSLNDKVHISSQASWKLYRDIEGETEIPTKAINLEVGDNISYILVQSSNESALYKIAIRRLKLCTVTFDTDGGTQIPSQIVQEEGFAIKPSDPIKKGYTFVEWNQSLDCQIYNDTVFKAQYSANQYLITFDANGGECPKNMRVTYGQYVIIPVPTKTGYSFLHWYDNSSIVEDGIWNIDRDVLLVACYTPIIYSIKYVLNGGVNNISNPLTYTIEDTVSFADPTRADYTFLYWQCEGKEISEITKGTYGDITIVANWKICQYDVKLFSNDESKGKVYGSGNYIFGTTISISAKPANNCFFKGWFSDNQYKNIISVDNPYTLSVPSGGITLYAKFNAQEEEEEPWNKAHGVIPVIAEDNTSLTFGLYPQSHVKDPDKGLINAGNDKNDEEYFVYNDEYYVKDTANLYKYGSYSFKDGTKIYSGTTYYFKCEPIKWNICLNSTETFVIDSSNTIYGRRFDDDENVYANSEIRYWLNNDFFNKAFSVKKTSNYIKDTFLEDCNITDKVWLGSNDQYKGDWPRYNKSDSRHKKVTDFALCNGVCGSDVYWTRSPNERNSTLSGYISNDCEVYDTGDVYITYFGVAPSVTIKSN